MRGLCPLAAPFLLPVALEHRRVEIDHGPERGRSEARERRPPQHRGEVLDLAADEPPKVPHHRHRRRHPPHPQDGSHDRVVAQALDVRTTGSNPPHPLTGFVVYATASRAAVAAALSPLCIVLFLPVPSSELANPASTKRNQDDAFFKARLNCGVWTQLDRGLARVP